MTSGDDFRLDSYKLLLELDASTTGMMQLVSSRVTSGPEWDLAIERHRIAYETWSSFLNKPIGNPGI
ncbi:hypothetical protein OH720_18660 [Pseudomonas sp. WJP1]|jgi:hypothetical protein|nr:hypothetical protein [Pseudomonas sp. WJP1]WCM54520.1 hypothetical protein OH720_18660 [Pseudomonas sp. WJP1]